MKIKNENFFVIYGFMLNELNLKGNELLVYALIYGFSQNENKCFSGSVNYISNWTGISSRTTIFKVLNSLIEKSLIKKEEEYKNNVKFCKYKALIKNFKEDLQNQTTSTKNLLEDAENELGIVQNMYEGGTEIEPNNIDIIYKDNIENNIFKEKYKKEKNLFFEDEKENKDFKLKNSNEIISYINSLDIGKSYKNKLIEFYEYRKIIKRPIRSEKVIDFILKQDFINEEHAILCIDSAIGNEYMRVLPEYISYEEFEEKIYFLKKPQFLEN